MPSLIKGYNYDIFISYRQKDNKHDGWVTEFVDNLQGELESTFKKEISVYFDVNPHDGLLETHDVDESLKDKLKCLILIPIISRTYCDPEAFAWEHEFKTFIEQASKDEFGLKVKLPNGNVASRVLPVIIYDLDKQDIKLCESALGGALRGVEFIYKSAGVNRPLRSKDDLIIEPGKVYYRDQVNKVANTIKDVLNSMRGKGVSGEVTTETISEDKGIITEKPLKEKPRKAPKVSLLYRLKSHATLNLKAWRIIALILFIGCFSGYWLYINKPSYSDKPVLRYDIPLAVDIEGGYKTLAISPDGEYLVYNMNGELNLKKLNSDAPLMPISGTSNSRSPFFSPNGKWIGFVNSQKIMKIPLTGGNPIPICDIDNLSMNQANWYDNEIIFAGGSSIYRVPDSGGEPELLYPLNQSENDPRIWNPQLLPDKKTLLFSQLNGEKGWSIMTWTLGSKENPSVLIENGRDGRYLKSGYLAYSLNKRLYVNKFNPKTNRIISEPQIITTNPVYEWWNIVLGQSQFDFSDNGILVYSEQSETSQKHLVWVDESGVVTPPITKEAKDYSYLAISSDAQYIAASVFSEGRNNSHIEIINTETGNSQLFAEDATCPVWSSDNSSVIYVAGIQVVQKPLDRSTPPVMLFEIGGSTRIKNLSSDGKYLPLYNNKERESWWDIGYYDMVNNRVEMLNYYNSDGTDIGPTISPDGKWIAYESRTSGQAAIYVAPFPGPGLPRRVISVRTTNDIQAPVWAPDMTALYYYTTNPDFELWRINMQFSDGDFSFEPAQSFFNGGSNFILTEVLEIHPSDGRFLLQQLESGTDEVFEPRIKVIVNWEQELEGD